MTELHAKISPSSFSRVKACPASLQFANKFPNETNQAAEEGTACHEAVERMLNGDFSIGPGFVAENGIEITVEHMAHIDEAIEWVREQGFDRIFTEVKVPVGAAIGLNDPSLMWGTSDVVGIKGSAVSVVDFKFGFSPIEARSPVTREPNAQGMCYLTGALHFLREHLKPEQKLDSLEIVIVQPRAGGVKATVITWDELQEFKDEALKAVTLAQSDEAPFNPGEAQCRFCPASGHCKAQLLDEFGDLEAIEDTNEIPDDELAVWLDKVDHIISTAKAMQLAAIQRMLAGRTVPGWELDQGSGRARWIDEDEVIEEIRSAGLDLDEYAPRRPATQTALKAKTALGPEVVESLVTRPKGEVKLVRAGEAKNPVKPEFEVLD